MDVAVETGLVLPLVRVVEVLVVIVTLLCVAEEEEADEEEGRGKVVPTGQEEEEEEEVWVLELGEGRMGREYVRRAGVAVEVSFGGAGTRRCGEGGAAAAFGPWDDDRDGAGVRGGGGEEVVGVRVGAGESRSMGLGVRRGGVGVVGVDGSGVEVEG